MHCLSVTVTWAVCPVCKVFHVAAGRLNNAELSAFKAETVIFPELTGRYPHVPVILCATKCDDESVSNGEDDGAGAANAAMVAPTSGNGDLAVINEEDR